jgi:hypothetical protein
VEASNCEAAERSMPAALARLMNSSSNFLAWSLMPE